MGHTLSHRITPEFSENIRHGHIALFTGPFYIYHDLIDHELVIVIESKGMFDGKAPADIDGIQFGANFLQLAIEIDDLVEFAPVIDIVLNALVEENMKHLELEPVLISLYLVDIEFQHIPGPEAQSAGIKGESGFFFGCYPDSQFEGGLDGFLILLQFILIVKHRNHVLETGIKEGSDPADIGFLFKSVADDVDILSDLFFLVKFLDDLDIIGI
jgi:hypothetical protein